LRYLLNQASIKKFDEVAPYLSHIKYLVTLVASLGLQATLRVREQLTTAMEVSMSWGYASVPVSFTCMAFEMVRLLWQDLRGGQR